MTKQLITTLFVIISFQSFSQRIYWATEVVDFSSALSAYEYSPDQVLGKPNVLPQGGDNPNAWMPAKPNKLEFITVRFEKDIVVQQILIAESYNPSAVYEVYLYDARGKEYLVNTFEPKPLELKSRLLRINIDKTEYEVDALRLVIDGRKVPGYIGIDAIGISSSFRPIEVEVEQPQNIKENLLVERLDENVNSEYQETRPLISPDGKTLYYARSRHPDNVGGIEDENDIWYSTLNEETGEWEESKNLGGPLNNSGSNFISSITPDGNSMTVVLGNKYSGKDKMKPGISIANKTEDGWTEPETLNITNAYITGTDNNYFMANNRSTLIMAVDRYDTYGGKDLYVSFLQKNGKWTEPMNLGNDINTANSESSPYLAADNETLYFSSAGFSGYGESDVYISRRLDDTWTNWTEPENLGPDINSTGEDVFFNIPPSGKYAYYSKAQEKGNGDIYRIELPVFYQPSPVVNLKGVIRDSETNEPVVAKIDFTLLPENTSVGFTVSDSTTGEYEILLPVGSSYDFVAEADGYKSFKDNLDLSDQSDFSEMSKDIVLVKGEDVPVVAVISPEEQQKVEDFVAKRLDSLIVGSSILFDFASDYLNPAGYPLLDQIITYLQDDESIALVISGHTDSVGPEQFNMGLSERRANSVMKYFVQKGISDDRLTIIGYGETKPIATNDTSEGRQKNRRVEFTRKAE